MELYAASWTAPSRAFPNHSYDVLMTGERRAGEPNVKPLMLVPMPEDGATLVPVPGADEVRSTLHDVSDLECVVCFRGAGEALGWLGLRCPHFACVDCAGWLAAVQGPRPHCPACHGRPAGDQGPRLEAVRRGVERMVWLGAATEAEPEEPRLLELDTDSEADV